MLMFTPISKRTGICFPSIVAYPTLSLPNQQDLASSFNTGIRFLGHMHNATHLTFWEEHFPWPFWAALGASILLHLVSPLSLNPSYPSGLQADGTVMRKVPSLITGITLLLLLFIMVCNTGCLNMWWEQGSSGGGQWGIPAPS